MLLEQISNACGVSGHEDAVRRLIIDAVSPYADHVEVDALGSVIALKKGYKQDKKVMLAVHMDEPGLICSGITEKGYLKFKTVGNVDTRYLISKKVITEKGIHGIIGMKAIHLQKPEERKAITPASALFVDIGAASKEEAEKNVSLGDYIFFDTRYRENENGRVFLKAASSAAGCAAAAALIERDYPNDTYFCFAAQHHVGARGMMAAAFRIAPDAALVMGGTESGDVRKAAKEQQHSHLSKGAVVSFMDRSFLADRKLSGALLEKARENGIMVQTSCSISAGSDAGAVYTAGNGIKTAYVGIPCRYLNTPVSCMERCDFEAGKELAYLFMTKAIELV